MVVYLVSHVHADPEFPDAEEIYHIGIYSSRAKAEEAVAQVRSQPGFVDVPDGFDISREIVDQTHWKEGYVRDWAER